VEASRISTQVTVPAGTVRQVARESGLGEAAPAPVAESAVRT